MNMKEKLLYPFYVVTHPFQGFYEIRHREKGNVKIALLLVFLFAFSFAINRRYAGFIVNGEYIRMLNAVTDITGVFAAVFLVAIANWSITCLLNGEGRFKDILNVIGYSMLPMAVTFLPATLLSQFIVADERSIYFLLIALSIIYFAILFLIGIMTVHNYSFGKTILTLCFTLFAMFVILFIILLIVQLITGLYTFIEGVYTEIVVRM